MGFQSAPKLERRLQTRKIFDECDTSNRGQLSMNDFCFAMSRSQTVRDYFSGHNADASTIFRSIDTDGDGVISWEEFVNYCSNMDENVETDAVQPGAKAGGEDLADGATTDSNEHVQDINDPDAVARFLQVEFREDQSMIITIMEPGDTRVLVAPKNQLLKLNSTSHAIDVAAEYAHRLNLSPTQHAVLFEHVERAIIKACIQELRMLRVAKRECENEMDSMATMLMEEETKYINRLQHELEAQSDSKIMTPEEYLASLPSPVTPGSLAKTLANLQMQLEVAKQAATKRRAQSVKAGAPGAAGVEQLNDLMNMSTVDLDGDGIITRSEWRQWMEQKTAILKASNDQRQHLIQENSKLRKIIQDSKSPIAAAAASERCQRERQELWRTMTTVQVQLSRLRIDMERGRKELHEALVPFHASWFEEAQAHHNYEDLDKLDLLLRWEQSRAEQLLANDAKAQEHRKKKAMLLDKIAELENRLEQLEAPETQA